MDRGANTRIVSLVLPRLHTFCVTFCTTPCAHVHGTDGVNVSHHGKQKVDGFLFVRVKSVYKNFLSPLFIRGIYSPIIAATDEKMHRLFYVRPKNKSKTSCYTIYWLVSRLSSLVSPINYFSALCVDDEEVIEDAILIITYQALPLISQWRIWRMSWSQSLQGPD